MVSEGKGRGGRRVRVGRGEEKMGQINEGEQRKQVRMEGE